MAVTLPCGDMAGDTAATSPCRCTMMDELGSCRAVSLAASARHAAAESGAWPGSREHDDASRSSCACMTANASRALDVFVGDGDRGGGFFVGDSERLIGTDSWDAPPGLNGLPPRSSACAAANPLLRLLGQSGLSMGDGEQDLDCGDGDGDGDADRDGCLSGELELLILSGDAERLSIRERLLGATFALRGDRQPVEPGGQPGRGLREICHEALNKKQQNGREHGTTHLSYLL